MKLTTVEEMRNIDRRAIEEVGIPEVVLMENAAREVYDALDDLLDGVAGKRICVIAGTGNNGGDAFAVTRYIANAGGRPKVFVLGQTDRMTSSAAINFNIICNMGIEVFTLATDRDWDKLLVVLKTADGVVDGLLGTGFQGQLRAEAIRLIQTINNSLLPVLSIDVPSGVNADNGQVESVAIRAAETVTLGEPKWGIMFAPGSVHCGKLVTDGIGIPAGLLEDPKIQQEMLLEDNVREILQPRAVDCHKGSCGKVLVIAGSKGMTGAATLSAMSALRVGAGVVTLACAESLNQIFEVKLTEVMTKPLPDEGTGYLLRSAGEQLLTLSEQYDVALLGPGLGRQESTLAMVRDFAAKARLPLVIDADAIYAFKEQGDLLAKCYQIPVVTPHLGEMAVLLGISVPELKESLLELTREAAKEYNAIFVVKSETTIIVYPDGMAYVASTGNPGMATAGCGDVLAGTIAGIYRQSLEGKAALAGTHIHGRAGDKAAEFLGNGLVASDIVKQLPVVLQELGRNS